MPVSLRSILIDDNPQHLKSLSEQLRNRCPQVEIVAESNDPIEGLQRIKELKPDLLFTDVQMPQLNGLELAKEVFNSLKEVPEIIFVTGYEEFAIRAFEVNACHYLLKPPTDLQLITAVEKAEKIIESKSKDQEKPEGISNLLQYLSQPKISIPTMQGSDFISVQDIVRVESDNNLSNWHMVNQKVYKAVSRSLKEAEEMLDLYQFVRCHNRHIVNPVYIAQYIKPGFFRTGKQAGGGQLSLSNGETIPVSREGRNRLKARKLIS